MSLITKIFTIFLFSISFHFVGEQASKLIKIKSKLIACITTFVILILFSPLVDYFFADSSYLICIPILASAYYGYMNGIRKSKIHKKHQDKSKNKDEFSTVKTRKKVDSSEKSINKTKIDSISTKKRKGEIDKSISIISEMGEVPIENTIFELSISLSESIEKEFNEINASNRMYVLWEISMFYSILAYTCQEKILENDYEGMNNTFGVMAREIATNEKMDKETKRKAYDQYLDTISVRVNDYQGGTTKEFCMKLFQNIARLCEIENLQFWMAGSVFVHGETVLFTSSVNDSNGNYAHIQ